MISSKQLSNKIEYESKIQKEKKDIEKRKYILVLIYNYLINNAYAETAIKLNDESKLELDNYELADNIDLNIVYTEYESYFEHKFSKKPKVIYSSNNNSNKNSINISKRKSSKLPNILNKKKKTNDNLNEDNITNNNVNNKHLIKIESDINKKEKLNSDKEITLEVIGTKVNINSNLKDITIIKNKFKERKDNILLKPLPDIFYNEELKELAAIVKREIIIDNPNVLFNDIIGLDTPKKIIKEALFDPLIYPDLFTGILEPWKGVLMFGPPGTGKTMLAKAVSSEMPSTFFNISASTIVSKWRGDSEKLIRVLFDLARHYQPSTIFLDEIDSIMNSRSGKDEHDGSRRMKTELLIQLDGLSRKENERVFLLAASNLPWDLDQALLRRLEKRILIGFPDKKTKENMLKKFIPENKQKDLDYSNYVDKLNNYSGSDVKLVCKEALMNVARRVIQRSEKLINVSKSNCKNINLNNNNDDIMFVTNNDMDLAISKVKPSSIYSEDRYSNWMNSHGSD